MKILFVSRRFYPEVIGGGQISPLYIAKALQAQGHEVHVLTFGKSAAEFDFNGVKIHRRPIKELVFFRQFSNTGYMWRQIANSTASYVRLLKPDVVHLLNFESILKTSILLKKRFSSLPVFATANGPLFECFTGAAIDYHGVTCIKCRAGKRLRCCIAKWGLLKGSAYWLYSISYRRLLHKSYRRIDHFFPVSRAVIPLLRNAGVPAEKLSVVHNPVDLHQKVKSSVKKRLGLQDYKILLYAGRLEEDKGIGKIIGAIKDLPDVALVIVGKGNYEQKLRLLVEKSALGARVRFIGFVDNAKLGEFYSMTDLVVFPCAVYETLSRMLLEAASYGIPIIASDVGGNSDIVEDGRNGLLLESGDAISPAIARLLSDKKVYAKMGKYAKEKMKREFSPQLVAKMLLKEYQTSSRISRDKISGKAGPALK